MKLVENVSLNTHSAMAVGGVARFGADINTEDDVRDLHKVALREQLPFFVVGEGTNTLFASGTLAIVIGFMKLRGIATIHEDDTCTLIQAAAGEQWDDLVAWTVSKNLSGLEALSYIPGTVGAAPIQNIGAYGSEFKDTCQSVTVYDTRTSAIRNLSVDECAFSYRNSIFKQHPGQFVVLSVILKLSKIKPKLPQYKDVEEYFANTQPNTVQEIRDAIITIRTRKLPDYKTVPNLGSFFKNPIVPRSALHSMQTHYPDVPHSDISTHEVKLYAGWLIDQLGLRGKTINGLVIHERNALILTNPNHLPYDAVHHAEQEIIKQIQQRFGITLEREPVLIS